MPNDANALNIMAIIHSQAGYDDYAEKLYLYGLKYAQTTETNKKHQHLDLLNNYHSLLKRQDRLKEAEVIYSQIGMSKEINPFKWINLGNNAYNKRNFHIAIYYY